MTDYKKNTGSSGTMMIRDTGSVVEFWLNSNNGSTFVNELPWGYTINGSTNNSRETRYSAGAGWVKFGSWTVTSDQTVTFRLLDTGTSGFGGPTTFSQFINRASAPNPPSTPNLTNITTTTVDVTFSDGANNGASIDSRQVGVSKTNNPSTAGLVASDGSTTVGGLQSGVTYYFWARTHNSKGWSSFSGVRATTLPQLPYPPNMPIVSDATQTTVVASFTDNYDGGSSIVGREIAYGTSLITGVEASVGYSDVMTIPNLKPGTTYYFWSRVRNAFGWSGYSAPAVLRTVAGARVNVNGVWKDAVPYVNVNGTWKLARPWGRVAGVWKQST